MQPPCLALLRLLLLLLLLLAVGARAAPSKSFPVAPSPPVNLTLVGLTTLPKHGLLGIGHSLVVVLNFTQTEGAEFEYDGLTTIFVDRSDCFLNERRVANTFYRVSPYLYALKYAVREGDPEASRVSFVCSFRGTGSRVIKVARKLDVGVDGVRPHVTSASVIKTSHEPSAIIGSVITVEVEADNDHKDLSVHKCLINGQATTKSVNLGRGVHTLDYVVREGDPDIKRTGSLPFVCTFVDAAGNSGTLGPLGLTIWFAVDAHRPVFSAARIASTSADPARISTRVAVALVAGEPDLTWRYCRLNGMDVADTVNATVLVHGAFQYQFMLHITAGQADWAEGEMPIDCMAVDQAGNSAGVTAFTDGNRLKCNAHTPRIWDYLPTFLLALAFVMVAIASHSVATVFRWAGLPLVVGYLFTGVVAGPEWLQMIPLSGIRSLRFVDEASLAFLAISAGGQVQAPARPLQLKSNACLTVSLVLCELAVGSATVMAMAPHIDFMAGMDTWKVRTHRSPHEVLCVAEPCVA